MGIPKFYVEQSGQYGEITVQYVRQVHHSTGKNMSQLNLYHNGFMVLGADFSRNHLKFFTTPDGEATQVDVINEALRQIDYFRSLMIVKRYDKWMMVISGRFVPFMSGMEVTMWSDEFYASYPFIRKNKKGVNV